MTQITHVAMTDSLKIELIGTQSEGEKFSYNVYELIDGSWQYLDAARTSLDVNSSDRAIRELLFSIASICSENYKAAGHCSLNEIKNLTAVL